MHIATNAELLLGKVLNEKLEHEFTTPDVDYAWSPIPEVKFEFTDSGANGVVIKATAFGILHTQRTIVAPGLHDFHVAIGSFSIAGTFNLLP